MTKLTSVEVDKDVLAQQIFEEKGIPSVLRHVKMVAQEDEDEVKLAKKFLSAVKRSLKKSLGDCNREEKMKLFDTYNILPEERIHLEEIKGTAAEIGHMQRLFAACGKLYPGESLPDVVKVTMKKPDGQTLTGYTMVNGELKPSYHRTTRDFQVGSGFGFRLMLDLHSLLAEYIAYQSILQFSQKNTELLKYVFIQSVVVGQDLLPMKESFRETLKQDASVYGIELDIDRPRRYSSYLSRFNAPYLGQPSEGFSIKGHWHVNFHLLYGVQEFVQQLVGVSYRIKEELKERSEYAKSYETKKNIKKSHLDKMADNVFLKKFGFVELDNDVDLDKFKIIESNFEELEKAFPLPPCSDYSFRIRKLGRLKAGGVHYPFAQTTVFDLRQPNSFVHECMHQIDYVEGKHKSGTLLSESLEFRVIKDRYATLVQSAVDALPDGDSFKEQWNGSTKYNRHYYLQAEEVFARCGEIYVSSLNLPPNSLFKDEKELSERLVYPLDDTFKEEIARYFTPMFDRLRDNVKPSPTKSGNGFQQLALF